MTTLKSTGRLSIWSLPATMRETSSRSLMSCACTRVLRSMLASAEAASSPDSRPERSISTQPSMAVSGVRSSCESVARN